MDVSNVSFMMEKKVDVFSGEKWASLAKVKRKQSSQGGQHAEKWKEKLR